MQELLGRAITLVFSDRNADKNETGEDNTSNEQVVES